MRISDWSSDVCSSDLEAAGLDMADMLGDIPVHRVHRTEAASAPEERVERELQGSCPAIGSTSGLRDGIGEQCNFGIDERRERVILPQRIDLGHIRDIKRGLLEADRKSTRLNSSH